MQWTKRQRCGLVEECLEEVVYVQLQHLHGCLDLVFLVRLTEARENGVLSRGMGRGLRRSKVSAGSEA